MKFTLIYDGELPSGNGKRALYASKVRNHLHPQMRDLWNNHILMRQLAHEARVFSKPATMLGGSKAPSIPRDYPDLPPPLTPGGMVVDLAAPIDKPEVGVFLPLVRQSLYLACAIDILFLRHEEPMHLFTQGGDLDNRLKCFFDGLKIPDKEQAENGEDPIAEPLCCLLEDDKWISDFSVRSGRLLGKSEKGRYDVRIQADITIKVLRVFDGNLGLVGG